MSNSDERGRLSTVCFLCFLVPDHLHRNAMPEREPGLSEPMRGVALK
jgi:hypothetical protein